MKWRHDELRLIQRGRQVDPASRAGRDRLLAAFSTASALSLTAASVKAAIAYEVSKAAGLLSLGSAGLLKASAVGSSAGAALGLTMQVVSPDLPPDAPSPTDEGARPELTTSATLPASEPGFPRELARDAGKRETEGKEPTAESRADDPDPAAGSAASRSGEPRDAFDASASDAGDADAGDAALGPRDAALGPRDAGTSISSESPEAQPMRDALRALDAARVAIEAGDATGADRALAAYETHRGDGALDPEYALLRLRALVLVGEGAQAARLAQEWLERHPHSPYARSLRALIEEHR